MNVYELFRGIYCGESVIVAILRGEIGSLDGDLEVVMTADFFRPSTTHIQKIGEIQITGDISSLPTYWTFDGN